MTKTLKTIAVILFVAAELGISSSHCADQPDQPSIKQYEGRVSYLDWVASKMILNGVGQMEFYVPSGTKISKISKSIHFSDLNILDNATVSYYEDPSGKNVAVRITITVV